MHLEQIDATGCKLIGAMTKGLGYSGPKHHAIVIGKGISDGLIYIAESMSSGYQIKTYDDFYQRYAKNGDIQVRANEGGFDNLTVARRALAEVKKGGEGLYHLVVNNCESFANRAMHDNSKSQQVINTALGLLVVASAFYLIKKHSK